MPIVTESKELRLLGNRYRLLRRVGKGGMALVFEGYDQMLERPVAIKLLKQDFSTDQAFRERFKQEARSAANLSHPNIVIVHDFGVDSGGLFIVMEFISGTDLKTKIIEKKRYSALEGIPLIIQVCSGLGYAHRAGLVHCDVKPQNILISRDNRVKITDFGIARALSTIQADQKSDVVWGSPQYLSPEQAMGEPPSPASDVYSLGVVMYEMFTGQLPFGTSDVNKLIGLHQSTNPVPPRVLNPEIPQELEQILLKVLAKEPTARYRTADQLGHVLEKMLSKLLGAISAPPPLVPNESLPDTIVTTPPSITPEDYQIKEKIPIDWQMIGLELLTLLAAGGLIPFWLYVWFKISPFLR